MTNKKKKPTQQQQGTVEQYLRTKMRDLPIGDCYVNKGWEENGMATVIVARNHKQSTYTVGYYLVDTFCTGVKDSFYKFSIHKEELEDLIDTLSSSLDMVKIPYEEAHNIIYGAISFAEDAGIQPCKRFELTQYILEEDDEKIPLIEYEFGKDGKYLLMARNMLEASQYLLIMKQYLPADEYDYIIGGDEMDDEEAPEAYEEEDEYDENEEEGETELTEEQQQQLEKIMESMKAYQATPNTPYTYQHPEYPTTLMLFHPSIAADFYNPDYCYRLPKKKVKEILDFSHHKLVSDLEQITLYELGQTCDRIPTDEERDLDCAMIYTLIFLGEVHGKHTLDVVLETLKQNDRYYDYHFGDFLTTIYVPTLYLLIKNDEDALQKLTDYLHIPGLYTGARSLIFLAVAHLGCQHPKRRAEAVEWFRQILNFYTEQLPIGLEYCDSKLAQFLVSALTDFHAVELLPEIEALYATGQVQSLFFLNFDGVKEELENPDLLPGMGNYEVNIYRRIKDLERDAEK